MNGNTLIYIRVSSDRQVDNMSLSEQERICREFCEHSSQADFKIEKVFREEGESAKTADRTELQNMLEYCRESKGVIRHLVVYKLDRFSRRVEDHTALQMLLKKLGVMLWSATEPISDTTTGKLMEHVLASFAQFDNDVRSERSGNGMKARALEGGWVSHAPVGYVNVKDSLKRPTLGYADDDTVRAVRKFFDEFLTGKYRQSDAPMLAEKCGVRTASGKPLSRTSSIVMLNNIVYAGYVKNRLTDNKTVEGLHIQSAIISLEQYKAIQDILAGRRRSYAPPPTFKLKWPLKRFLRCGICGNPLTGSAPKGNGGAYEAYHCTHCTIKRDGQRVSLPKAQAHDDFGALLESLVPSEWALKVFKEIVVRRWNRDFRDVQEQRRKIDGQLQTLEDRKNELFDRWMAGRVKEDKDYDEQNQRIAVQKESLELERAELKSDELDKERIVDGAVHFIANAREIWLSAPAENKVRFQKLVFEAGVPVFPDRTFGTVDPSPIYQQLAEIEKYLETNKAELPTENSALVHPAGFEPATNWFEASYSNPLSYGCAC